MMRPDILRLGAIAAVGLVAGIYFLYLGNNTERVIVIAFGVLGLLGAAMMAVVIVQEMRKPK